MKLSDLGIEVRKSIEYICGNDKGVEIPRYVIMPNHVHMIVTLETVDNIAATTGGRENHGRAWKPDPTDCGGPYKLGTVG